MNLETDYKLREAIEAVTRGNLDCNGNCNNWSCDGSHPENCNDPAVVLWRDGGSEDELINWLDENYPDWKEFDVALCWGAGELQCL